MKHLNTTALAVLLAVALIVPVRGHADDHDDDGDDRGRLIKVNCNREGQTITKALRRAKPGDTIQFMHTCRERVTITVHQLSLVGKDESAVIDGGGGGTPGEVAEGQVNIVGVQGVVLAGFTVQNSPVDGINGRQGSAFTVRNIRVRRSVDDGLEATETSTVRVLEVCDVQGSGDSGIALTDGSSGLVIDARVTMTQNVTAGMFLIGTSTVGFRSGTVDTHKNTWGILALGHSSLTLGSNGPIIRAQHNNVDGILVADTSDLRLDGGRILASYNGRTGLRFGGTAGLGNIFGEIVSEENAEGLHAEDASRISQLIAGRMTVQNNTVGIIGVNGSNIRISGGGTITGNGTDIALSFGSLGTFEDSDIGTFKCDSTSNIRGDEGVTCPTP